MPLDADFRRRILPFRDVGFADLSGLPPYRTVVDEHDDHRTGRLHP